MDNTRDIPALADGSKDGRGATPSVPEVCAAYRRWQKACKFRVRRPHGGLSPMEEMAWFDTPRTTVYHLAVGTDVVIALPNAQRVALLFSVFDPGTGLSFTLAQNTQGAIGGTFNPTTGAVNETLNTLGFVATGTVGSTGVLVSPIPSTSLIGPLANTRQGLFLGVGKPVLQLIQRDVGPLVQMGWQGGSDGSGPYDLTVIEVVLRDWPKQE